MQGQRSLVVVYFGSGSMFLQILMSEDLYLLPALLDQINESSTGVFSLIGCSLTANLSTKKTTKKTIKSLRETAENCCGSITIFNAFRSGQIEDLFNEVNSQIHDNESFLGDKLVAGVDIVGLLVVFNSTSAAEGDSKDMLHNGEQIQKALFKALFPLQTKKEKCIPKSLIGIVYDVFLKQIRCAAFKKDTESKRLQKVPCEIHPREVMDSSAFQFCFYKLKVNLNLKMGSSEFGNYDTILEKISQNVHGQLSSERSVICIDDESIFMPEENISESLSAIQSPVDASSKTLNIAIFPNVAHLDNQKQLVDIDECTMCVEIREPATVVGLLHPQNTESWSVFLKEVKKDLCDSLYCRISEVFDRTATSSVSKAVSIPLPARTYFKCSSTNLPLFCTYSDSQTEFLNENLILTSSPFSSVSEVLNERIKAVENHENDDLSSNKVSIIICIFVIILSIVVAVFASLNK